MQGRELIAAAIGTTLLAGCGPSVERAFSNCVDTAYKQTITGGKGVLPKDLAKVYEKTARAQAERQCSLIRDECRKNPQSDECKSLVQQYGK